MLCFLPNHIQIKQQCTCWLLVVAYYDCSAALICLQTQQAIGLKATGLFVLCKSYKVHWKFANSLYSCFEMSWHILVCNNVSWICRVHFISEKPVTPTPAPSLPPGTWCLRSTNYWSWQPTLRTSRNHHCAHLLPIVTHTWTSSPPWLLSLHIAL
jgi:hypothetical protein